MDKLCSLSNNLDGRDKLYKTTQYLLKIIITSSENKDLINKLTTIFSKYVYNIHNIYIIYTYRPD